MMGWRFYRLSLSAIHTFLIVLTLLQPHSASLTSASLHNSPQSISSPGKPLASQHHFHHFLPDDNDTTFPEKADAAPGVISNTPPAATHEEVGGAMVARSKRDRPSWNSLQGYWGKRDSEARPAWNNFRGSWGKKADWSSLRGSWGKRASDMKGGWSGLRGSWGKRAEDDLQHAVEPDLPTDLSKRAGWSSLQGSWGKRGEGLKSNQKRAGWSSLQGSWGKRNSLEGESSLLPHIRPSEEEQDSEEASSRQYMRRFRDDEEEDLFLQELASFLARSYEQKRLLSQGISPEFLSQAGIMGQQQDGEGGLEDGFGDRTGSPVAEGIQESSAGLDSDVSVVKRETPRQYVSSGWLKRPDGLLVVPRSTNWSSLRGSWGKRGGPGSWSQMRGTWGKRPDLEKWSSLRGSWGKRGGDANWSSLRGSWGKREPDNNWGSFRGSWGKRDSDGVSGEQTE